MSNLAYTLLVAALFLQAELKMAFYDSSESILEKLLNR